MNLDNVFCNQEEKPLEHLLPDGGYASVFRTVCCVGDSLSSGEFESIGPDGKRGYHDMFEYSWGQYMARICGSRVYNFSKGGMTAKHYCESFAEERGFWDPQYAAQCYIVALGVNDLLNQNTPPGSMDDIDLLDWRNNKDTFAGNYGRIISRLKEIQPRAKFFLMTMMKTRNEERNRKSEVHRRLLYEMAALFDNTYVIDLYTYAPLDDEAYREKFFLNGHLNPMGYLLSAKTVISYIDYIIRHHMEEFREVAFIGTDLHG